MTKKFVSLSVEDFARLMYALLLLYQGKRVTPFEKKGFALFYARLEKEIVDPVIAERLKGEK